MKRILAAAAFAAALFAGCGGGTTSPVVPTSSGQVPDVASIRLYEPRETEVTAHIPLVQGRVDTIEVRLYAADGSRITFEPGGAKLTFTFDPASLAQGMPLDTLLWTVTPTDTVGAGGSLSISLTLLATNTTRPTFGPFSVLIHPGS